jgi:hypothetical protein
MRHESIHCGLALCVGVPVALRPNPDLAQRRNLNRRLRFVNTWRQREKDRPHRDTQALENDLVRAQRRREQAEAKRKPRNLKNEIGIL